MNISYVGKRPELTPDQQRKLDAKWDKIAKLIEWKGQREAHVVITNERHLHQRGSDGATSTITVGGCRIKRGLLHRRALRRWTSSKSRRS